MILCINWKKCYKLQIEANKSFIGATVYDALGNPHLIDRKSVADHPNEIGMSAIANAIYNAIMNKNNLGN